MSTLVAQPIPLFDTLENISSAPDTVYTYLDSLLIPAAKKEFALCTEFLKSYAHSNDTFTAYRREVERVLHWAWLVCKKSLKDITRNDIRDYLAFVNAPPKTWISTKTVNRFLNKEGLRVANTEWRPFVVRVSKIAKRHGKEALKADYQLSSKSIAAIFATLSSLYSFLQQESYLETNPISLIRQKKGYIQREQGARKVTRKLSKLQWHHVITAAETLATEDPQHERSLFLMTAFYLLGVRISELSHSPQRMATMGSFAPDKQSLWWFTTVGKGNKIRDIAVPDELLSALKRYRQYLGLTPLPSREEATPLLPKVKGRSGLGSRQIRNIVQDVFDRAISQLLTAGKNDEAEDLATATVHWLRHTAISSDIEFRPREHIRDDVGHENPATMDKYIDIDRVARHRSAKHKKLKPEVSE